MNSWKNLIVVIGLSCSMSGCAALVLGGAAGAGSVAFLEGALQSRLESPLADAVPATQAALEKLEFREISHDGDALSAKFLAKDAQHRLIEIKLKRETDSFTSISIRVGVFGDERSSVLILDEIRKQLHPQIATAGTVP